MRFPECADGWLSGCAAAENTFDARNSVRWMRLCDSRHEHQSGALEVLRFVPQELGGDDPHADACGLLIGRYSPTVPLSARAFVNNLTGDWTVALKAEPFNSCAETPGRQSVNNEAASKGKKKQNTSLGQKRPAHAVQKPPLQYLRYNAGFMEAFGTLSWKSVGSSEFSVEERGRAGARHSFLEHIFMLFNVK